MTDQNSQFFAMLTAVGEAKQANADALGIAWKITQMGVGDANGTEPIPNRQQTVLINERRRAPLNQLKVDPNNASILIAEQVIPEDVGGWWIREIGLYDEVGDLVAIANCAPSFKPQLSQGSGRTQVVRMNFIVSSAANVELKIDPSVVLATRKYVDDELAKLDHKQSVRYATTAAIALAGLAVQAGGDWAAALTAGDRVLVKNQAAGKDNGIYAVAAGAWLRVADADGSPEVTSGLVVSVEQGATLADTRWQLVTDGAIVLGTTALVFQNVTQGFAPLASPALTGNPTAPTPAQFDNDSSIATTEFVQRALGSYNGYTGISVSRSLLPSDIGKAVFVASGGWQITAPTPGSMGVPIGAAVTFFGTVGTNSTIVPGPGAVINTATGSIPSVSLKTGQSLTLVALTNSLWQVLNSTATLGENESFAAALSANGYQKLPSGLIEQWGITGGAAQNVPVTVTFPIAFPTACRSIQLTYVDGAVSQPATRGAPAQVGNFGASSFQYSHAGSASNAQHLWFAIGY